MAAAAILLPSGTWQGVVNHVAYGRYRLYYYRMEHVHLRLLRELKQMIANVVKRARRVVNAVQKKFASKALILMYHRVAELNCNPWGTCVSPKNFSEHLEVLKTSAAVIPLQELARVHKQGKIPSRAVVITFDDGYIDNFGHAKSLLERYGTPANVFLTSGYIGHVREFWWDELERIFLSPGRLPGTLTLAANHRLHSWDLGQAAEFTQTDYERECHVPAWQAKGDSRHAICYSVWKTLYRLPMKEQELALDSILQWSKIVPIPRPDYRLMNWEEVRELTSGGLIEVGAHTVHHPFLPSLGKRHQWEEIYRSKNYIEEMLGMPVSTFAYPFGAYNQQTVAFVKEIGFDCACTTAEVPVWWKCDRHELPRFNLRDWDGEEFSKKLWEWFQS